MASEHVGNLVDAFLVIGDDFPTLSVSDVRVAGGVEQPGRRDRVQPQSLLEVFDGLWRLPGPGEWPDDETSAKGVTASILPKSMSY